MCGYLNCKSDVYKIAVIEVTPGIRLDCVTLYHGVHLPADHDNLFEHTIRGTAVVGHEDGFMHSYWSIY